MVEKLLMREISSCFQCCYYYNYHGSSMCCHGRSGPADRYNAPEGDREIPTPTGIPEWCPLPTITSDPKSWISSSKD